MLRIPPAGGAGIVLEKSALIKKVLSCSAQISLEGTHGNVKLIQGPNNQEFISEAF